MLVRYFIIILTFMTHAHSLTIHTHNNKSHTFNVELALTPQQQQQGLMYRKHLPKDQGMLFIYPSFRNITMWMKNTYIPLDMVFISPNYQITTIVENTTPLSLTHISAPGIAVLELPSGTCKKHHITKGHAVSLGLP